MSISLFEIFKIGIGPSSSHTVGPMHAARQFIEKLATEGLLGPALSRIEVELFGSLGHTGRGHGTDKALILGLLGERPDLVEIDHIPKLLAQIEHDGQLSLNAGVRIPFDSNSMKFHKRKSLPLHPNGMRFSAWTEQQATPFCAEYYSVGGGFVVQAGAEALVKDTTPLSNPFTTGARLLEICEKKGIGVAAVMRENELAWRQEQEINSQLDKIWDTMKACTQRGCLAVGTLPGGLGLKRRAPELFESLKRQRDLHAGDQLAALDWVNLYAVAVNEENAAGGRIVTAPTNGAAGVLPAVLHYYVNFCDGPNTQGVRDFLLSAAAIAVIYLENASISGAEVGCQGEVGVACSMAAAGLTAALGGTAAQVENAAEIGMEHNLGLTCDPVGGLVQIPCIERNAMGAVKAINAQRLAMQGDGEHHVSLDKVIRTMRETGADMKSKYKETSRGGLAVNIVEC